MNQTLNVVIGTLNSQYIHSSLAPWCLLCGIKANCEGEISAAVVEGTINETTKDAADRILRSNPDVVCLCCYIWNIRQTLEMIRRIKHVLPDTVIVLGGPEVSYNARQVLLDNMVDFVVCGEGELPLALLLNALRQQTDIQGIPGLCYKTEVGISACEPCVQEEEPSSPYRDEYFQALRGRIAYIETSRGCPFSCAFCLSGRCGSVRYFDLGRVKHEIIRLANSGTRTVKFVDRTFNANSERACALFSFIIQNFGSSIPTDVCFHFEIAGDLLDDRTIELLSGAPVGLMQFEIGLQSFNAQTLQSIHRNTDLELLKENIRRLAVPGNIHLHIDLIAGLPQEDLTSFEDSFNEAYSLCPQMLQLGFLKLLHGSEMREKPKDYPCEYTPDPPYEVIQTPWLSTSEVQLLHRLEDALNRLFNSGRFKRTIDYLVNTIGYTPFALFRFFGDYACDKVAADISLDDYTALFFRYFSKRDGVDPIRLRDMLVCDRLVTNASGFLPKALRIEDPMLRRIKAEINRKVTKPAGVKRAVALLYSRQCAVYVDYQDKNAVTGEYELKEYHEDGLQMPKAAETEVVL